MLVVTTIDTERGDAMENTLQLQLPTGTWVLDSSATTVTITARKLLAFRVPATLTITSGAIEIADGRVLSVDVVADAASYACKNAKRNDHILDAANHPTVRFQAHDAESDAAGGTASGSITVKGRTTPITVAISDIDIDIDGDTATFHASAVVDRTDLGVDKLPSSIIGPKLGLTVTAAASRTDRVPHTIINQPEES